MKKASDYLKMKQPTKLHFTHQHFTNVFIVLTLSCAGLIELVLPAESKAPKYIFSFIHPSTFKTQVRVLGGGALQKLTVGDVGLQCNIHHVDWQSITGQQFRNSSVLGSEFFERIPHSMERICNLHTQTGGVIRTPHPGLPTETPYLQYVCPSALL